MSSTDEIIQQLTDAINNPPQLDQDAAKAISDNLANSVSSDDATKQLIAEIQDLSKATLALDDSFHNITNALATVKTNTTNNASLQSDVTGLQTTWAGYRTNFINLLWLSREVAGKAEAAANDYAGDFITFLSDDTVPVADKKAEIANYIVQLGTEQKLAEQMTQGFTNLSQDISTFQTNWQDTVTKYDLESLAKQITDLQGSMDTLNKEIVQLDAKIKQLAIAVGVLGGAVAVSFILGFVCPGFWALTVATAVGTAVSGGLLGVAIKQRNELQSQVNSLTTQRDQLVATQTAVQQLQSELDSSANDFTTIIGRIAAFANVWASITTDIGQVNDDLDNVNNTISASFFKTRLNTASKLYASLAVILREYQTQVTSTNPIFDSIN